MRLTGTPRTPVARLAPPALVRPAASLAQPWRVVRKGPPVAARGKRRHSRRALRRDESGGDRIWTWAWASWHTADTAPGGSADIAALSHEIAEWFNDPFSSNMVPPWEAPPDYPCTNLICVPYQKATFVTPAFPGYTSGHSTFSRAGAEVLAAFTGSAFFPGGLGEFVAPQNAFLKFELGPSETVVLQWATYYIASVDAGLSRIYGGLRQFY